MDVGSALLASVPATLAFALVVGTLRATGRTDLDPLLALGRRLAPDASAAFVLGSVALVGLEALDALLLAVLWALTGWPIAPLQGA